MAAEPSIAEALSAALTLHQAGRLDAAQASYSAVLARDPDQPDALHLLGVIAHQRGDSTAAVDLITRALRLRPQFALAHNNLGGILRDTGRLTDAAAAYAEALRLKPDLIGAELGLAAVSEADGDLEAAARRLAALAARHAEIPAIWLDLGRVRRRQRRFDAALAALARASALDPALFAAHNERGIAHHEAGRFAAAAASYEDALRCNGDGAIALRNLGHTLKRMNRLDDAVTCYRHAAAHRFLHCARDAATLDLPTYTTTTGVKLAHDLAQFHHLGMPAVAARYAAVLGAVQARAGPTDVVRLTAHERMMLGPDYNRRQHVVETPALPDDPLGAWDRTRLEADYLAARPELVVIDDFLSPAALAALRRYCVESTLWFDFSHHDGYLGAALDDGFDCPLMLQIAQALRDALPHVLAPHPLAHLWAYKHNSQLKGVGVHGDDAAVNVNFWITPDDANLEPGAGGLLVWPALAPPDWRFADFNADGARIEAFLAEHGGPPQRVPYRANRAVVFNSSLFHATDRFRFGSGLDQRRINITMLFGERRT